MLKLINDKGTKRAFRLVDTLWVLWWILFLNVALQQLLGEFVFNNQIFKNCIAAFLVMAPWVNLLFELIYGDRSARTYAICAVPIFLSLSVLLLLSARSPSLHLLVEERIFPGMQICLYQSDTPLSSARVTKLEVAIFPGFIWEKTLRVESIN